jgi:hypothetical protein
MIIFVAVVDGLFARFRNPDGAGRMNVGQLEKDINSIVTALKDQGHLSAFIDYLLDYDKKRRTTLYKDINSLRISPQDFR